MVVIVLIIPLIILINLRRQADKNQYSRANYYIENKEKITNLRKKYLVQPLVAVASSLLLAGFVYVLSFTNVAIFNYVPLCLMFRVFIAFFSLFFVFWIVIDHYILGVRVINIANYIKNILFSAIITFYILVFYPPIDVFLSNSSQGSLQELIIILVIIDVIFVTLLLLYSRNVGFFEFYLCGQGSVYQLRKNIYELQKIEFGIKNHLEQLIKKYRIINSSLYCILILSTVFFFFMPNMLRRLLMKNEHIELINFATYLLSLLVLISLINKTISYKRRHPLHSLKKLEEFKKIVKLQEENQL